MKDKFIFEPLPAQEAAGQESSVLKQSKNALPFSPKSALLLCLCFLLILLSFSFLNGSNSSNLVVPKKTLKAENPLKKKPVYFNYFDSVVFLNDWTNEKVVVSKGIDEYVKQERLVIKANGYYFNCYCKDLLGAYAVGDTIP